MLKLCSASLPIFFCITFFAGGVVGSSNPDVWIEVENIASCRVKSPTPQFKTTARWNGNCVSGRATGKGRLLTTIVTPDNKKIENSYEGILENGELNGEIKIISTSGEKFTGNYIDGLKNGPGIYEWPDGKIYKGEYKYNVPNGLGYLQQSSEEYFRGNFKDGLRDGSGVQIFASGDSHAGEYKNGYENGHGTYTWASGTKYIGDFVNGLKHGSGAIFYPNGDVKYEGGMFKGQFNGKGTFYWESGQKYGGHWKEGDMHGVGTFSSSEGILYTGLWENNAFLGFSDLYAVSPEGLYRVEMASGGFLEFSFQKTLLEGAEYLSSHGVRNGSVIERGNWNVFTSQLEFSRMLMGKSLSQCGSPYISGFNDFMVNVRDEKGKIIEGLYVTHSPNTCRAYGVNVATCSITNVCMVEWRADKHQTFYVQGWEKAKRLWNELPKRGFEVTPKKWVGSGSDPCTGSFGRPECIGYDTGVYYSIFGLW